MLPGRVSERGSDRPRTPKRGIKSDRVICWRNEMRILGLFQHASVLFLAGWIAAISDHPAALFLYFYSNFFRHSASSRAQNNLYYIHMLI